MICAFLKGKSIQKSMIINGFLKPISMLLTFIYTPLLLRYLGTSLYGIWATMLSIVNWINYFDVGMGHGLRNAVTDYMTVGNKIGTKRAVSTGYIAMSIISAVLLIIGEAFFIIMDLQNFFKTDVNIKYPIMILYACTCFSFVLALVKSLLYALQKAELVGMLSVIVQLGNLLGILLLLQLTKKSILALSLLVGASSVIAYSAITLILWNKKPETIPSIEEFDKKELSTVCNVGIYFFVIQIAGLVLYSTDNIIITYLQGSVSVTSYNTAYQVFHGLVAIFTAFLEPLWSKYTEVSRRGDYNWIEITIYKLEKILPFIAFVFMFATIIFKPFTYIWLSKKLDFDDGLVVVMAFCQFLYVWGTIYIFAINGMGMVKFEMVISLIAAFANIPLSLLLGGMCGLRTTGVCLATLLCQLFENIACMIYIKKIITWKVLKRRGM